MISALHLVRGEQQDSELINPTALAFDSSGNLFAAADVVCLSSDAEGVPMVLVEAMAAGKPVVATDVGGVSDAVEAGSTGLLVPRDDQPAFARALLELARAPELAKELGDSARARHRERFGVERMVNRYSDVFEHVLSARRRRT